MNILITGGAGFIGSHLAELLLRTGHSVSVMDNLSTGKRENLPQHKNLEFIAGDVADMGAVSRAIRGKDAIFHLAAVASVQASIDDPIGTHRTNLAGTLCVLEAAKLGGVSRVVYASSAAVYGDKQRLPIAEAAPGEPLSPYAADKLAGEHYLAHYHRQGWLIGTAFRFFNVFGPRQDPSSPYSGVISIFTERILRGQGVTIFGDGQQTRDFVFVRDLVRALAQSLDWPREESLPVVNIGRGKSVSLLELLETIEGISGRPVERSFAPARSGDIRHSLADIEQLRRRLPGMSFASLHEGLRSTMALGD